MLVTSMTVMAANATNGDCGAVSVQTPSWGGARPTPDVVLWALPRGGRRGDTRSRDMDLGTGTARGTLPRHRVVRAVAGRVGGGDRTYPVLHPRARTGHGVPAAVADHVGTPVHRSRPPADAAVDRRGRSGAVRPEA